MYQAAMYLRLSKEDKKAGESNSISNQRNLIQKYAVSLDDVEICSERVDDGYSGGDFQRPGFLALMEDIKNKKINCIIVKDLSRFGRNYIESGRYIENIFPFLGIRFISVNDGYDSKNQSSSDSMMIPFKNLVNDVYRRDISMKIKSQLEVKRSRGDFVGSFVVYGYQKQPENKNKLYPDVYASNIVRQIFRWKLEGMSQQKIADKLNEINEPSPLEYKRCLGMNYTTSFEQETKACWSASAVGRILSNPIYTGILIQGKSKSAGYKTQERVSCLPDEWSVIENNHQPIISSMEFEVIQNLLKRDIRSAPGKEMIYPYAGLLFCGYCDNSMVRKIVPQKGKKYLYYVCSIHRVGLGCKNVNFSGKILEQGCLFILKILFDVLIGKVEAWNKIMKQHQNTEHILLLESQKNKYQYLKKAVYEDWKSGILAEREYAEWEKEYSQKEMEVQELLRKQKELEKDEIITETFRLSEEKVRFFVDKIKLYRKSKLEIMFSFGLFNG